MLETIMSTARHGTSFLDDSGKGKTPPASHSQFRSRLFTRSIDWDPAFRSANRWYDRVAAVLRLSDRDDYKKELAALNGELKELKMEVNDTGLFEKAFMGPARRGETIGNILTGMLLPAFYKVRSAADRCQQKHSNLQVAFALAAYQRDHGRYPEKLDELAPNYLPEIPNDLFSGKPLIYRLEEKGYILYSVGPNGTDDAGRGPDDEPPGDDLSIRMPARELPGRE